MRISGLIRDAGVAEVIQIVHLGGRTGKLELESGARRAHVDFVLGRIVGAWSDTVEPIDNILFESDFSLDDQAQAALTPLGADLVDTDGLRELSPGARGQTRRTLADEVASVLNEVISWKNGSFVFHVSSEPVQEASLLSTLPLHHEQVLDTQKLLLEAVRRQALGGSPVGSYEDPGVGLGLQAPRRAERSGHTASGAVLQIVSTDDAFVEQLSHALGGDIEISRVAVRDAGATPPGAAAVFALLDLRNAVSLDELEQAARRRPRAILVAVAADTDAIADAYVKGATLVVPESIAAIAASIRGAHARRVGHGNPDSETRSIGRILRFLHEIRSGVYSATTSLSLMTIVSEYAERGVLFIAQRGEVRAIGGFGRRVPDGRPLTEAMRTFFFSLAEASGFLEVIEKRKMVRVPFDPAILSEKFVQSLGPPVRHEGFLIPVLGRQNVIALLYGDNGAIDSEMSGLDVVEIALSQAGLALETELLQQRLASARGPRGVDSR
jgi:Domain of unknown function (DUF4388)